MKRFNECWLIERNGWISEKGYTRIKLSSQTYTLHKLLYEQVVGAIPDNTELDHLCRNRSCVNPSHLEPVSHLENVRRGDAGKWLKTKTRCPQGHPYSSENIRYRSGNRRVCLECGREYMRNRRKRERSAHVQKI